MTSLLPLLPLVPALLAWVYRDRLPRGGWLLVAAFAVSTVGDLWSRLEGGAWWPSYVWLPAQLGLALWIVLPRHHRVMWLCALGVFACYDMLFVTGPDLLVTALGSVGVVVHTLRTGHRLGVPLVLYFGLGSALYLGMAASLDGGAFMAWWWAYQGVRVLAWTAFGVLVWQCGHRARPVHRSPSDYLLYGPRMTPANMLDHHH